MLLSAEGASLNVMMPRMRESVGARANRTVNVGSWGHQLLAWCDRGGREDFEKASGALDEAGASAGRGCAPLAGPPGSVEPEGGFVKEAKEVGEVDGERGAGRGYVDGGGHCGGGGKPARYP